MPQQKEEEVPQQRKGAPAESGCPNIGRTPQQRRLTLERSSRGRAPQQGQGAPAKTGRYSRGRAPQEMQGVPAEAENPAEEGA